MSLTAIIGVASALPSMAALLWLDSATTQRQARRSARFDRRNETVDDHLPQGRARFEKDSTQRKGSTAVTSEGERPLVWENHTCMPLRAGHDMMHGLERYRRSG